MSVRVLETRSIVANEIFPDVNIEDWQVSDDSIELPRGALIENSENGLVRIVFAAFDRLESILKPLDVALADQKQYGKFSRNELMYFHLEAFYTAFPNMKIQVHQMSSIVAVATIIHTAKQHNRHAFEFSTVKSYQPV